MQWAVERAALSRMSQAHTLVRFLTKGPGVFKHILKFYLLLETNKQENFRDLMVEEVFCLVVV